jgi:hypothetical protein
MAGPFFDTAERARLLPPRRSKLYAARISVCEPHVSPKSRGGAGLAAAFVTVGRLHREQFDPELLQSAEQPV